MDSFIQRFSSNRWPITIQKQRSATNKVTDTTDAWSEVDKLSIFVNTNPRSNPPIILAFTIFPKYQKFQSWNLRGQLPQLLQILPINKMQRIILGSINQTKLKLSHNFNLHNTIRKTHNIYNLNWSKKLWN